MSKQKKLRFQYRAQIGNHPRIRFFSTSDYIYPTREMAEQAGLKAVRDAGWPESMARVLVNDKRFWYPIFNAMPHLRRRYAA